MPDRDRQPSPLRELLAHIEAAKQASGSADGGNGLSPQVSPSALLDEFQQLWGNIRTATQLRQSLAAVPEDAGPLHSSALLHRAMTLMQNAAPGYLQHFIAYVDTLSWIEQMLAVGTLDGGVDAGNPTRKPAAKPRPRKRG